MMPCPAPGRGCALWGLLLAVVVAMPGLLLPLHGALSAGLWLRLTWPTDSNDRRILDRFQWDCVANRGGIRGRILGRYRCPVTGLIG